MHPELHLAPLNRRVVSVAEAWGMLGMLGASAPMFAGDLPCKKACCHAGPYTREAQSADTQWTTTTRRPSRTMLL
jgi:hypothetical protein